MHDLNVESVIGPMGTDRTRDLSFSSNLHTIKEEEEDLPVGTCEKSMQELLLSIGHVLSRIHNLLASNQGGTDVLCLDMEETVRILLASSGSIARGLKRSYQANPLFSEDLASFADKLDLVRDSYKDFARNQYYLLRLLAILEKFYHSVGRIVKVRNDKV